MAPSTPTLRCLALTAAMIAGILISGSHQASAAKCEKNNNHSLEQLVSNCGAYVMKSGAKETPSRACCDVVKKAEVACVCSLVTKDIERLIDMAKVVYVAASCGKKLAPGSKCGSYRVPAA